VGDAGYNRDFVTAQGILDAFRDAELCATAIDQSLSGARPFEDAMGEYQRTATLTSGRCTISPATSQR
jgi:flavin-dependent dehydrogenase